MESEKLATKKSLDKYVFWLRAKAERGEDLTPVQRQAIKESSSKTGIIDCEDCDGCNVCQ